ncbi:hypothetical protein CXB51_013323 [Gossypium anomalum]|uniref:Uncharacterized protein n=1 Tax=Gossypium anomalum TaxID=47600 RepID=A0A8J5Z834_9ROSI|nr:hypothetical protein CXB51_013323 [Gossypium anomalum]
MGDDKSTIVMGSRDLELLIPVGDSVHDDSSKHSPSFAPSHHSGRETFYKVFQSWASKKFMTGWSLYVFSSFYFLVGLGFVTSITFIFVIGVFMSSWLGASVLGLGEWFIKRMPFVRHIYNASKQISSAISPDQSSQAFKEVAIIKHPRIGEYAFGFITSSVTLQKFCGEEELCCVYVPTNHLYIGDIFLINTQDVIRPNLSVREGIGKGSSSFVVVVMVCMKKERNLFLLQNLSLHLIHSSITEIVVSGGMSMPQMLTTIDTQLPPLERSRSDIT